MPSPRKRREKQKKRVEAVQAVTVKVKKEKVGIIKKIKNFLKKLFGRGKG
jgi:hypothetical protein